MKVLFLGRDDSEILAHLREEHGDVVAHAKHYSEFATDVELSDFIVSHGYRHLLPPSLLATFSGRAINCHISYLPWNRGADPNLWSWLDGTPRGVTIHYLDEGVDTGDIIARRAVDFSSTIDAETLATTYRRLQAEIAELFRNVWPTVRSGECERQRQRGLGSLHRMRDKELYSHLLVDGWDTSIVRLVYPVSRFATVPARG